MSTLPQRLLRSAVLALSTCLSLWCQAQQDVPGNASVTAAGVGEIVLPAPAKKFVPFYSGPQIDFTIDPDSISVLPGADAEVRYALKATSKQGAVNLSYEGIRCSNRSKIVYAVGTKDGGWSLAREPQWSAIYVQGINVPHATLANSFFCSVVSVAGNAETIRRRLISNKPMEP